MIELKNDNLVFLFPELHPQATFSINFQRTLRIPDDDREYPLPPGLGSFPLSHVDDYLKKVPEKWNEQGGVMFPMHQTEALWLNFVNNSRSFPYPFAVKIATGKINAVNGELWNDKLHKKPQDYIVVPDQPWLDGYSIGEGIIRQFVAMPLGAGYSAEEQISDKDEYGGIQLIVYPMKKEIYEKYLSEKQGLQMDYICESRVYTEKTLDMGLAPGGKMTQSIEKDSYESNCWDLNNSSRCFIHIANSLDWKVITDTEPPQMPPAAKDYSENGLPWFDYYDEKQNSLGGSFVLNKLKSVFAMGKEKRKMSLPENESVNPKNIKKIRKNLKKNQVREENF